MSRRWQRIPDFPKYEASDDGKVRNAKTGYVLSQMDERGYRRVCLRRDGHSYHRFVHRLVLKAFRRMPEEHEQTNHLNCDKADNRVENLEWCTQSENRAHSFRVGNEDHTGENHNNSEFTEDEIVEIRRRYRDEDIGMVELGREYGTSRKTIWDYVHGRRWPHADGPIKGEDYE